MRTGWLLVGISAAVRLRNEDTTNGVEEFLACLDAIPVFNLTNVRDCCELISASSMAAAHSVDPSLMVPEVVLACVERSSPKQCVSGDAARKADEAALMAPELNSSAGGAPPAGPETPAPAQLAASRRTALSEPGASSAGALPQRAPAPVRAPLPSTEELEAELGLPSSAALARELADAQRETARPGE